MIPGLQTYALRMAMRALARLLGAALAAAALLGCDAPDDPTQSAAKNAASAKSATPTKDPERAAILEVLTDKDATADARLDSIHRAREMRLTEAVPALRALLRDEDPDIVVAAAATLDGIDAQDADLDLIEAAGALGRARQFEHLRQLLYLIGSVGGPRAQTYLETVAEGHELPPIRATAAQILKDSKTAPR